MPNFIYQFFSRSEELSPEEVNEERIKRLPFYWKKVKRQSSEKKFEH
tara:strand:+ start:187 stop:327 length:141 start_codon:yes stop_codon:yes gene_type:complete